MMPFAKLYEVRDAIEQQLGAERAKELDIGIEVLAHRDAITVTMAGKHGFIIDRRALEDDSWRTDLQQCLDQMIAEITAAQEPGP